MGVRVRLRVSVSVSVSCAFCTISTCTAAMFGDAGGTVTVPAIDLSRATVKGDGLSRAAVDQPATFRVNTKASGDADLDVAVTGTSDVTRRR